MRWRAVTVQLLAGWLTCGGYAAEVRADRWAPGLESCTSRVKGDCLMAVADFAGAAEEDERFALEHPRDFGAPRVLARAVFLRRALGDLSPALRDAGAFAALYENDAHIVEVADEVFMAAEDQAVRGDDAAARAAFEPFLRDWARWASPDLIVVAHVRLASLLWERSCLGPTVNGACVERRPIWRGCKKTHDVCYHCPVCREHWHERFLRRPRRPADVAAAAAHARAALELASSAPVMVGGRDDRERARRAEDLRSAMAQAHVLTAEADLEELLELHFPDGLDFSLPDDRDSLARQRAAARRRERSQARFTAYLERKAELLNAIQGRLRRAVELDDPLWSIAAAARMGEAYYWISRELYGPDTFQGADGCFGNGDGEPHVFETGAEKAFQYCVERSGTLSLSTEWARLCKERLRELQGAPGESEPVPALPLREVLPSPVLPAVRGSLQ